MTSGGTTINIICGMKYTTEMICGGGAEHYERRGISKSKLEIEISEKKKRKICVFLREKGRKRPPAAFKLGGWGRGTFPECSFGDKELNLANQSPPAI